MRTMFLAVFSLCALGAPATAQAPRAQTPPPSQEFILGGDPPQSRSRQTCVDVEIGSDRAFGCINQQLRRQVDRANPGSIAPPFDARSQDIGIGLSNIPAVRQQYGPNFGRSVVPYRPPPPVFTAPWAHP